MTNPNRPPRFKAFQAPTAIAAQKISKTGNYRGSPRDRGYDGAWDRMSLAYRKRFPFCEWCAQQGRDALTDLVNHIIPVTDRPDLIHSWKNLISACTYCHGVMGRMEIYARENGLIDSLPAWHREPDKRPPQFRNTAFICAPA